MPEEPEEFEVREGVESVTATSRNEGTNASRFALLATLGRNRPGSRRAQLAIDVEAFLRFGMNPELAFGPGPADFRQLDVQAARMLVDSPDGARWDPDERRWLAWHDLNEQANRLARLPLLMAGLSSSLERESTVAAAVLMNTLETPEDGPSWPWILMWESFGLFSMRMQLLRAMEASSIYDPEDEQYLTFVWDGQEWESAASSAIDIAIADRNGARLLEVVRGLAELRVSIARRSDDPIVRELASAVDLHRAAGEQSRFEAAADGYHIVPTSPGASLMVHGTAAWTGDWWQPGGDFHSYIRAGYRPGLYDGGRQFSWSGKLSPKHRGLAGERLKAWIESDDSGASLHTAFGHSYGAEVIARAVNEGARVDEVVFLSAPIHHHHDQMASRVRRVIDVRLRDDIVIRAALGRESLAPADNVTTYFVDRHFWSHKSTRYPHVWDREGIAAAVRL